MPLCTSMDNIFTTVFVTAESSPVEESHGEGLLLKDLMCILLSFLEVYMIPTRSFAGKSIQCCRSRRK